MPESQNTEWKSKWKDEYLEWICGYANAQGGKIYIGCDDEGNVIGLSNARKLLEDIPNKIRDAMGIIVGVNLLDKNGKEYIEIDVPPYPIGISCKGVYYYRSGSTRQILTARRWKPSSCESVARLGTICLSRLFRWMMWMTKRWLILSSGPPKRDALTEACWMSQKTC